jgi:hypothetical protein
MCKQHAEMNRQKSRANRQKKKDPERNVQRYVEGHHSVPDNRHSDADDDDHGDDKSDTDSYSNSVSLNEQFVPDNNYGRHHAPVHASRHSVQINAHTPHSRRDHDSAQPNSSGSLGKRKWVQNSPSRATKMPAHDAALAHACSVADYEEDEDDILSEGVLEEYRDIAEANQREVEERDEDERLVREFYTGRGRQCARPPWSHSSRVQQQRDTPKLLSKPPTESLLKGLIQPYVPRSQRQIQATSEPPAAQPVSDGPYNSVEAKEVKEATYPKDAWECFDAESNDVE